MKRLALVVVALAVIVTMPASAQGGAPVKNALVVVNGRQELILQSIMASGGSPSNILKELEMANLLQVPEFLFPAAALVTAGLVAILAWKRLSR